MAQTAQEIIADAMFDQGALFLDNLRAREIEDRAYASRFPSGNRTRQSAEASANAAERARHLAARSDINVTRRAMLICDQTGSAVVALNVACKLLGIPAHLRTAAAVKLDEGK